MFPGTVAKFSFLSLDPEAGLSVLTCFLVPEPECFSSASLVPSSLPPLLQLRANQAQAKKA